MKARRWTKFSMTAASVFVWMAGAALLASSMAQAQDSQWIQPSKQGEPLIWGRRDGVIFGLPSPGGMPGPRGLIRVGVISPKTGSPELLNFIAIEPVVAGRGSRDDRAAASELEPSDLDPGSPGKRLWVGDSANWSGGFLFKVLHDGTTTQKLSVPIEVERFHENGAHVYLIASIDSSHPGELRLQVFRHDDSPPIEELTLTATMGNYERLRWLWLKNRVVDSREIYRSYRGDDFTEHGTYPLRKMLRTAEGDAIVFCTTNEAVPDANPNFKAADHWRYRLPRLTQYWQVPAAEIEPNLRVRVNGRRVYWASHAPLGGGVAFENFEVRQAFKPGQSFIFGVTGKEPWEIRPAIPFLSAPETPELN